MYESSADVWSWMTPYIPGFVVLIVLFLFGAFITLYINKKNGDD